MKKKILTFLFLALFSGTGLEAKTFEPKEKNIEIVVGYNPGGTVDKIARLIQTIFAKEGWKSIVVNKPGASQIIAANYVANQADRHGHTIFVSGTGLLDANLIFKDEVSGINYHNQSFQSVIALGTGTLVLTSSKNSNITSYEDFKNYVRKNPSNFKIGFWNKHLGETFKEWARLENLPTPDIVYYDGSGPQIIDLLGGHIKFSVDSYTATNQHWQKDSLNILAVFDKKDGLTKIQKIKNIHSVVSVPILQPKFELYTYYGVYAPADVDTKTIQLIHDIIYKSLADPEIKNFFDKIGVLDAGGDAASLDNYSRDLKNIIEHTIKNSKGNK
jgi:tripartite-type tricarboxylate transporter receptor subunit TctC